MLIFKMPKNLAHMRFTKMRLMDDNKGAPLLMQIARE